MQRWTAIAFVALFLASIAIVIAKAGGSHAPTAAGDAGADASPTSDAALEDASAPIDPDADTPSDLPPDGPGPILDGGTGVGRKLLSGEEPPPLGPDAPKSVVFGVILVQYKGAQGAPVSARPKDEALALAKTIAAEAAQDFKAAIQKGDKGSMENAGRIPRGVLEPAPEYVLFSLAKGGVSEPVDTPRGFWIVQRVE